MGSAFSPVANIPGGMTQLAQVVTSGSAASISFTNIPSNYTDLQIRFKGRATGAVGLSNVHMKLNSDATAANYLATQYQGAEATTSSPNTIASTTSGGFVFSAAGTTSAAAPLTSAVIDLNSYSETTLNKSYQVSFVEVYNTSNGKFVAIGGSEWLSTAAINRIDLTIASGSFLDGTTATLYGLGTGPGNSRGYAEVTANPTTNLVDGYKVYRTDLDLLIVYKAALGKWLTVNEYSNVIGIQNIMVMPVSTSGSNMYCTVRSDYQLYLTRLALSSAVQTTNSGSAFWTLAFKWGKTSGETTIVAPTTAADTHDVVTSHDQPINAVLDATTQYLTLVMTKTGTPGPVYAFPTIYYRLIVT